MIKIEHPRGPTRPAATARARTASGLWCKMLGRNKRRSRSTSRSPTAARSSCGWPTRRRRDRELPARARSSAGASARTSCSARNPRLVLARVTGFGQIGPYARRPGFGTLAEAMSGFAALTGEPDGPPTLPPFGLADGVAALATAFAVMVALRARERTGRGQVVDMSLIEPMMTLLGPQLTAYDQLGDVQPRTGNRSSHNAPRNTYRTADGRWVAVSTSATASPSA